MKVVRGLTVFYWGPIGPAIYWTTGRKQIPRDTIWRRGWRSTTHGCSCCGMGEIVGLLIAAGLRAQATWATALLTFAFAFTFGLALTVAPLVQDGVPCGTALRDGFTSETASIVVMAVVAIGLHLWLSGGVGLCDGLFWSLLVVSFSLGLLAAWPLKVRWLRGA